MTTNRSTDTWDRDDAGKLVIRLMIGLVFVFHGAQKLFGAWGGPGIDGMAGYNASLGIPLPELSAYLAAFAELFGGLAIAAGIFTRLAAVPVVFTMLVAGFVAHTGFAVQAGGGEYPLTLAAVTAGLAIAGPGRLTIARLLGAADDSILVRA
jgi:putative oxidoreductase